MWKHMCSNAIECPLHYTEESRRCLDTQENDYCSRECDGEDDEEDVITQQGRDYGYEECCIKNYANLIELGYYPGIFMDVVMEHNHHKDWVLCPICYDKYDKRSPNRTRTPLSFWGKGPEVDRVMAEYTDLKLSVLT